LAQLYRARAGHRADQRDHRYYKIYFFHYSFSFFIIRTHALDYLLLTYCGSVRSAERVHDPLEPFMMQFIQRLAQLFAQMADVERA
jgi:hypothetical protein